MVEAPALAPQWTLVLRAMALVENLFVPLIPGWLPLVPCPEPDLHTPEAATVRVTCVCVCVCACVRVRACMRARAACCERTACAACMLHERRDLRLAQ